MDLLALAVVVVPIDDLKEPLLALRPEHARRQFAQELLEHRSDRVHRVVVDVDQTPVLQEVDQLLHVGLVTGRAEHVLLERRLFVELKDEHQKRSRDVVVLAAHRLQRRPELHPKRHVLVM